MLLKFETVGSTRNGCAIYRKENGVGGHVYATDEIGGGVVIWDTSLVDSDTLMRCFILESERFYKEDERIYKEQRERRNVERKLEERRDAASR